MSRTVIVPSGSSSTNVLQWDAKSPGDVLDYHVDISQWLDDPTVSITSATLQASEGILASAPTISGDIVSTNISGGLAGYNYAVTFSIVLSNGNTLAPTVYLPAATAAFISNGSAVTLGPAGAQGPIGPQGLPGPAGTFSATILQTAFGSLTPVSVASLLNLGSAAGMDASVFASSASVGTIVAGQIAAGSYVTSTQVAAQISAGSFATPAQVGSIVSSQIAAGSYATAGQVSAQITAGSFATVTQVAAQITAGSYTTIAQISSGTLSAPVHQQTVGSAGATITLTPPNVYDITLGGNATLTFGTASAGAFVKVTAIVRQSGSGGFTLTLPANVKWPGNTPVPNTLSGGIDVFDFRTPDAGVTWFGAN